jgi:hypothetical protein
MSHLRNLIVKEKAEMEEAMDKVYEKSGVKFEGTGEESLSQLNANAMHEEDHPDYDPYGQLGYGFQAYFSSL